MVFTCRSRFSCLGAHPDGRATLTHVEHCLKKLRQKTVDDKITSLAIPRLATGVGGLSWDEVVPRVGQHLGDLKIPVMVYSTYHAGQKADEPWLA